MIRLYVLISFMIISLFATTMDDSRSLRLKIEKMKKEQRVALVIGNSRYSKPLPSLRNPVNDAKLMRNILEKRKFKVYFLENATKKEFKKAIRRFGDDLKQGGVGLFYFAGHGLQVNGFNYLVPTDADIEEKDDVEFEAIPLNFILQKMKDAHNRLNIVILDACRNDPFSRGVGEGGLAPTSAKGVFVAYATEAGSVASDGGDGKNGVFTKFLAKYIVKPLPIEEVFKDTRRDVFNYTDGKQSPGVYNQIMGDFYFTLPKISEQSRVNVPQESQSVSLNADKEMWDLIKNTKSISDVEYFLKTYPNSEFAPVARLKLQQLKRVQTKKAISFDKPLYSTKNEVRTRDTLFLDNFVDNRNNWAIRNDDKVKLAIRNGYYVFYHKRNYNAWTSWQDMKLSPYNDFEIETSMRHMSGVDNYAYSLMWGQDSNNCYIFGISANGQYLYGKYVNGNWKTLAGWTQSSYINKGDVQNTIAVKKEGDKLKLIINSQVVKIMPFEIFTGSNVGFSVTNRQKIYIDYLKVLQSKSSYSNINSSYLFYDDFLDNRNDWDIVNNSSVKLKIQNGYYIFKHKKNKGASLYWHKVRINKNRDFKITTAVKHMSGVDSYLYGIMWGEDSDNSYVFGISANGQYLYGKEVNGNWKTLAGWTKSPYINQGNVRNTISVKKEGDNLKLIINSQVVEVVPFEFFSGNNVGFYVGGKETLYFDYLKVRSFR